MVFKADEKAGSDMQKDADWKRNKALGDSMGLTIPAHSWYDRAGDLWKPGKMVTVVSPSLFLDDGFDFMIRQIEFNLSDTGADATLSLVPPQVFNGEALPDPWYSEENQ